MIEGNGILGPLMRRAVLSLAFVIGCHGSEVAAPTDANAEATADAEAGAIAGDCGATKGAKMVLVDSFCIDETEVTRGQYNEFLEAPAADRDEHAPKSCTWNTDYGAPETEPSRLQHPVGVDWCDAATYCAWAGKRLCGQIGGGPLPRAAWASASKSQWYRACTSGGTSVYPYGDAYDPGRCATDAVVVLPVKSFAECRGSAPPYSEILDMSGNAFEWEDSCTTPAPTATTLCRVRGGSFQGKDATRCDLDWQSDANTRLDGIGFRCCKG